jgi:diguanylate cyclase (GGDEF)-like protein/PAS domain S-box-containing protein
MATGSAWGMAGVIMEYHSLEEFHGLIIFILAGLAAGAISTNSAVFPVYLAFILPVLLPLDLMFLIKGDNVHYIMAALTTFFLAMMLVVSSRYNKVIKQAITQKFENQQILDELSISEQRFHDVALCSSDWIWEVDSEARYIYSAGRVKEILGYSPEELLGKTPFELMPDDEAERVGKIFRKICAQQEPIVDLEWNMFKNTEDGERIWILSNGVPVLDSSGNLEGYRGVDKDITERKQLEERLGHMATHDPLTGLYNRGELDRLLLEEVQRSARYSHPLSVLMIDVDHFKGINDTYGHQVGDEVLRNLAQMLTSFLRAMDHAGRYGGEEFLITLPETTATEAQVVAERIRKGIADSSVALSSGLDISFTVSIGVATHPDHGVDEDSVLSAADEALYRAKNSGRNRVCVAQARM